jgi:hypothetical protein
VSIELAIVWWPTVTLGLIWTTLVLLLLPVTGSQVSNHFSGRYSSYHNTFAKLFERNVEGQTQQYEKALHETI